jgi:catechol-2,3-dioxygenase
VRREKFIAHLLKSKIEEGKYQNNFQFYSLNFFMITKISHASLFVNDQAKAYDFYVTKLGFNVHTDVTMENGFRWLTVTPPEQP